MLTNLFRLDSNAARSRLALLMQLNAIPQKFSVLDKKTGLYRDANGSAVIHRQLEYVEKEVYKVEYPELMGRQIVPIDHSIPTGAESFLYTMYDRIGEAQFVRDWSTDFPTVTIEGTPFTQTIKHLGSAYAISVQQIRAAAMAGMPLNTELAETAREVIERKLDRILAVGDASAGLGGFANNPNVPIVPITGNWGPATPGATILVDLMKLHSAVFLGSPDNTEVDTLVVAPSIYDRFLNPLNEYNQASLMTWLKQNTPFKNIEKWSKLETAGAGGTPRMVAWRKDARTAKGVIPQEFETAAPFVQGFVTTTSCHLSTGGVVVRQPKKMAYADDPLA